MKLRDFTHRFQSLTADSVECRLIKWLLDAFGGDEAGGDGAGDRDEARTAVAPVEEDAEPVLAEFPFAGTVDGEHVRVPAHAHEAANVAELAGGEVVYKLENSVTGALTLTLTPGEADLDLIVVGADAAGGCNLAGECIAVSQTTGLAPEQLTFQATQGKTYYLIVDGPGAAPSSYTLDVSCEKSFCNACEPTEVSCGDGLDNDGDGLVDCADSDCAASGACP